MKMKKKTKTPRKPVRARPRSVDNKRCEEPARAQPEVAVAGVIEGLEHKLAEAMAVIRVALPIVRFAVAEVDVTTPNWPVGDLRTLAAYLRSPTLPWDDFERELATSFESYMPKERPPGKPSTPRSPEELAALRQIYLGSGLGT